MQVFRTVVWIVITIILVSFIAMNWEKAPVNIWPLEDSYLHFQWPVGVIALIFFLLGLVPMYMIHRAGRWRQNRRISSLENSVRAASTVTSSPHAADTAPAADSASHADIEEPGKDHPATS